MGNLDTMSFTSRLTELAGTARLLVISDFDGTLAGFSTDASNVPINAHAVSALQQLASLPDTTVVILSGRHLDGLKQASGFGSDFVLAGSHGLECPTAIFSMTDEQEQTLEQITTEFEALAKQVPGAFVEYKPFHRVLHIIRATDIAAAEAVYNQAAALDIPGAYFKPGKWIVEATAVNVTKGTWITQARELYQATGVIFLGDDRTDEDGFAALNSTDLSVKVGAGDTIAAVRVPDIDGVGGLLATLAELRASNSPTSVKAHV